MLLFSLSGNTTRICSLAVIKATVCDGFSLSLGRISNTNNSNQ